MMMNYEGVYVTYKSHERKEINIPNLQVACLDGDDD